MKTIAIMNPKGGTYKTTTVFNMAAVLQEKGYKVLVVDLDWQGVLTTAYGANAEKGHTVYDLLFCGVPAEKVIQRTKHGAIIAAYLVPFVLEDEPGFEIDCLKRALGPVCGNFDYILIDTPPMGGNLNVSALVAADEVLEPYVHTRSVMALDLEWISFAVKRVQREVNPDLKKPGVLLVASASSDYTEHAKDMLTGCAEKLGMTVYESVVFLDEEDGEPVENAYTAFVEEYLAAGN